MPEGNPVAEVSSDALEIILQEAAEDDADATWSILPHVYEELRRMAHGTGTSAPKPLTLQTTALVHETFLRLVTTARTQTWENRRMFFHAAAEAMRNVRIDYWRRRNSLKGGGKRAVFPLQDDDPVFNDNSVEIEFDALTHYLSELKMNHPVSYEVLRYRFFGGLTVRQTAELLGISVHKVGEWTQFARAWLMRKLNDRE